MIVLCRIRSRYLLVVARWSSGGAFLDVAGQPWAIADMFWASRPVSIFLMMPLSLLAWAKASGQSNHLEPSSFLGLFRASSVVLGTYPEPVDPADYFPEVPVTREGSASART
jgi:hypothetical protein